MPKRRTTPHPQSSRPVLPRRPSPPTPLAPTSAATSILVAVAPPGTRLTVRGALLRAPAPPTCTPWPTWLKQHARRYRRHGGHRRTGLRCTTCSKPGGSRFSWWTPARSNGPRAAPRATPRTPSGFAACTCLGLPRPRRRRPTRRGHPRVARVTCANAPGLVTECGRTCIQHMQKALEQINVKLTEAVSDITGKTGLSIIQAITMAGERDPDQAFMRMRDRRCQPVTPSRSAGALQGAGGEEHLFELRAGGRALGVTTTDKSASATSRPRTHLQTLQDPNALQVPWRKRKANGPRFDRGGRCTG